MTHTKTILAALLIGILFSCKPAPISVQVLIPHNDTMYFGPFVKGTGNYSSTTVIGHEGKRDTVIIQVKRAK